MQVSVGLLPTIVPFSLPPRTTTGGTSVSADGLGQVLTVVGGATNESFIHVLDLNDSRSETFPLVIDQGQGLSGGCAWTTHSRSSGAGQFLVDNGSRDTWAVIENDDNKFVGKAESNNFSTAQVFQRQTSTTKDGKSFLVSPTGTVATFNNGTFVGALPLNDDPEYTVDVIYGCSSGTVMWADTGDNATFFVSTLSDTMPKQGVTPPPTAPEPGCVSLVTSGSGRRLVYVASNTGGPAIYKWNLDNTSWETVYSSNDTQTQFQGLLSADVSGHTFVG